MTIKATYQAMQTVAANVLPTFTFYGMYKSQYNTISTIQDNTIIVEPPRQWPLNPRDTCKAKFTAKVWIGIRQSIAPATDGTFEYPPFNEIDIRDTLVTAANTFITGLNAYSTLQVVNDLDEDSLIATLYDAPEGQSTNWQAWVNFSVDLLSYGSAGAYIPPVFVPGLKCVTQLTIDNGTALATGLRPDVLFIRTAVINTDISVTPYVITVPAGYMLKSAVYYTSQPVTPFEDVIINSIENGNVFLNSDSVNYLIINAIYFQTPALPSTTYNLTAVGVGTTDTIQAILKFENVQQ